MDRVFLAWLLLIARGGSVTVDLVNGMRAPATTASRIFSYFSNLHGFNTFIQPDGSLITFI